MHELDLIPAEYRQERQKKRLMKRGFAVMVIGSVLLLGVHVLLQKEIRKLQGEANLQETRKQILQRMEDRLAELEGEERALKQHLKTLEDIRFNVQPSSIFSAIDKAIDSKNVWFSRWSYQVETAGIKNRVATDTLKKRGGRATDIKTKDNHEARVDITGRATNHAALSDFISRLVEQPRVGDARIVNTKQTKEGRRSIVTFRLVVTVKS